MNATLAVAALGAAAVACARQGTRACRGREDHDRTGSEPAPPVRPRRAGGPRRWWASTLEDAAVEGDPAGWARAAGAVGVAVALAGSWRGGPVGAVVLVAATLAAGAMVLRSRRGRRGHEADRRLPEVLDLVARGLRGGHDLRTSLAAAADVDGPHGAGLAMVVDRIDAGSTVAASVERWVADEPRRPVRVTGAALAVAAATGGRAATPLEGVAASLRARESTAAEARALATQARASAAVMVALPAVVGAVGVLTDPAVGAVLLGTPWGLGCLVSAVVLDLGGAWWMHRVVAGQR